MINKLTEVYIKWCNDFNIPNVSADEQNRDNLTDEQKKWLDDFIIKWDNQQEIDRFIYVNLKKSTRNKRVNNV
tara:strand:+ start:132 stop:350 length:219 start_codon:yes stop_codon:yes gene_type:complete